MLSTTEEKVLDVFRQYRVKTGQMLCFYGPQRERLEAPLRSLIERKLLEKDSFPGGYSLTRAGFAAMKQAGISLDAPLRH